MISDEVTRVGEAESDDVPIGSRSASSARTPSPSKRGVPVGKPYFPDPSGATRKAAEKLAKEAEAKRKKEEAEGEDKQRAKLFGKVMGYFHSKKLSKYTEGLCPPRSSASKAELEALLETIKACKKAGKKRHFVDTTFNGVVAGGEDVMVNVFQIPEARGFSKFVHEPEVYSEYFDEDLEELAIELDEKWVPGPLMSVCMGLGACATQFLNLKRAQASATENASNSNPDPGRDAAPGS